MKYLLFILTALFFISCAQDRPISQELTSFIPHNAALILKINNPDLFFSNLQNNSFLRENNTHPLFQHLRKQLTFFEHFSHKEPGFLSFSPTKEKNAPFVFISHGIPQIFGLDSVQNKKVVTQSQGNFKITTYTLDGKSTYTSTVDSIFFVSDSRELLEKSVNKNSKFAHNSDFEKALKAASTEEPTLFINHENIPLAFKKLFPEIDFSNFKKFSNWTSLDIEIDQRTIKLNGITTASDSIPKLINVFKGVSPVENQLANVAPANSTGFYSVTFENFPRLKQNLEEYSQSKSKEKTSEEQELLKTTVEAGMLYLNGNSVFAIRSLDVETSKATFISGKEKVEEFRGIGIYKSPNPKGFKNLLHPLISPENLNYFLFLDNFILFSEESQGLKEVVEHVQNKTTLATTEDFTASMKKLSTESSILLVANNKKFKNVLAENVPAEFKKATEALTFEGFPISALQFIYSTDFAHVHALLAKTQGTANEGGIAQTAKVALGSGLAAPPVFFDNHRTNGLDIAVQDSENTLYLISNQGEIYWKKDLDFRILGEIQQVDLYRNGRIQLAFATPHAIHVIDRDGNPVAPFPMEFNDEITQPLAIFDYDHNRKYRFLVVQGEDVFMYNSEGERVNGFTFDEAENEIVKTPKHIRIGLKDYILIAETSGKLNILSRTGKTRVPLSTNLEFSNNEWYEYENQFVSTNPEGTLIKIDQKGEISEEKLNLSEDHNIVATAHTLVSLSENKLSIKDHTISLDYGLYTAPQIFYINDKIYVSVTDTQSHRVFLFDSSAKLIPGFPVYGNSSIDLGNADSDSDLEFVVQGEDQGFIVYEISD